MPGIVGLVTKLPRVQAEAKLLRMVESLRHEAFYEVGTWINETLGVYVGWVARQGTFCSKMPVYNEGKSVCLIFAGEEFPEPGLAQKLKERGHEFPQDGPSYLVHRYEEEESFPASLNGRFQGLITDEARGTVTLFNDRYGLHRVYYHEDKEAFCFAAEAKAILAVRPALRSVNARSLGEYISCGCVLEDRTLFENIHLLPVASEWQFEGGALRRKGAYFQVDEWENQERLEPEAYYQELRRVFSPNLSRYLNGGQQVAVSLSGGLDTRMIIAWQRSSPGTLPCYSFGGMFRDCQDVVLARRIAKLCRQS